MLKRVVLIAGVTLGVLLGIGALPTAQAGPHGHGRAVHGGFGYGGHGHPHHHHHHRLGYWGGVYPGYRAYYPRPYYVPYVAPVPPIYAYPQPYYYNRGPSLFLGSGGMTVRVPF